MRDAAIEDHITADLHVAVVIAILTDRCGIDRVKNGVRLARILQREGGDEVRPATRRVALADSKPKMAKISPVSSFTVRKCDFPDSPSLVISAPAVTTSARISVQE